MKFSEIRMWYLSIDFVFNERASLCCLMTFHALAIEPEQRGTAGAIACGGSKT